ncbi:MAG TPA: discoidin domain-containing protein [Phycisphaerae bacterium]|nr:discoidin domain-containing protein [Phycisphaerae bacterium]
MKYLPLTLLLAAACLLPAAAHAADPAPTPAPASQWITIHNDFYWTDTDGNRILTRSGCLRQFNGTWYWYGGNPRGFREQYVYTSTDLVHWTNKGVIFRQDFDANRIDVLYNQPTKKYVMFLKYNGNGAHFAVATSDTPDGQFTFVSQTLVDNALMGDMSIYEDDDGKAYLAYVSWAVGTNAQHGIYALSDDYLTLDHRVYLWDIRSREAPHIFKRNGLYYYGTSRTAGIQSSGTSYYTATKLEGPWSPPKPLPTTGINGGSSSVNSWDSQVDFVYPFPNPKDPAQTFYMFAGDRWTKDLPKGRNGDYVWLPMEFDGNDPLVHYYQDWDLNVAAGTWRTFDPARNIAAGKSATASSAAPDHAAASATAPKTYDTYINTFWQSDTTEAQWITIDLQQPTPVNRVILKWGNIAAKDFKIQSSPDNTTWTDLFTTTKGGSYTVTDETFPLTTARFIRMTATARAPIPFGAFGGGRGRGNRGGRGAATQTAATQPTSAPAFTPPPQPAPTGYTLFDFEVLKD